MSQDEPWTEEKAQLMAESVSEMTNERLAKLYVVNLFPAVLAGKDSVFGRLQVAIKDEMWRREAKKKGELH